MAPEANRWHGTLRAACTLAALALATPAAAQRGLTVSASLVVPAVSQVRGVSAAAIETRTQSTVTVMQLATVGSNSAFMVIARPTGGAHTRGVRLLVRDAEGRFVSIDGPSAARGVVIGRGGRGDRVPVEVVFRLEGTGRLRLDDADVAALVAGISLQAVPQPAREAAAPPFPSPAAADVALR